MLNSPIFNEISIVHVNVRSRITERKQINYRGNCQNTN